jgi:hypothetical protein
MKKLEMNIKSNRNIIKNIPNTGIILMAILLIVACGRAGKENVMLNSEQEKKYEERMDFADSVAPEKPDLAENLNISTKNPENKKFVKTADVKFRVNKVISATEKIEDLTSRYNGYILYSNLQNREENFKRTKISRDSILISRQITVLNNIQLKVPNEKLDSFIRNLNPFICFLDYRVYKLDEVTLLCLSNNLKTKRLQTYEQRQTKHINTKDAKLKDIDYAEENLLNRQNEADDLTLNTLKLNEDIKYCTINMEIYQKSIIVREVIPDFNYVSNQKPAIMNRLGDSIIKGWWLLEEIIVFLVNIWGLVVLALVLIFGLKFTKRLYKKI